VDRFSPLQVALHAIGDRAVDEAIAAYDAALEAKGASHGAEAYLERGLLLRPHSPWTAHAQTLSVRAASQLPPQTLSVRVRVRDLKCSCRFPTTPSAARVMAAEAAAVAAAGGGAGPGVLPGELAAVKRRLATERPLTIEHAQVGAGHPRTLPAAPLAAARHLTRAGVFNS
jgi:hypothetical protein